MEWGIIAFSHSTMEARIKNWLSALVSELPGRGFDAIRNLNFSEDTLQMKTDRVRAHPQRIRNLRVRHAFCRAGDHLPLTRRKLVRRPARFMFALVHQPALCRRQRVHLLELCATLHNPANSGQETLHKTNAVLDSFRPYHQIGWRTHLSRQHSHAL